MSDCAATPARPARIVTAAVLTALEGVVIAGFGLASLVMLFTGDPDGTTQALTLSLTVLALSVLPLLAAQGLRRLRSWSRGPAMIIQLLALPVGWQMAQNGGVWLVGGLVIGAVALVALGCVVNPTATEALGIGAQRS
ncbi:hypothetical protein [Streptomyces oceani]|uniref:hypothetical protein n=1 Tax=Streptomyces oceani TaxID=1075402 RepID=UPI001FCDAC82|nr:hypothetical protein [Streptomyces oceani]